MKKNSKMFCAQKKKLYIVGLIVSIIVTIPISYFFGRIVDVIKNGEEFANTSVINLAIFSAPIIFIVILISILAVIAICGGSNNKNN